MREKIQIFAWPDAEVSTSDDHDNVYLDIDPDGDTPISMYPEEARKLAAALNKAANAEFVVAGSFHIMQAFDIARPEKVKPAIRVRPLVPVPVLNEEDAFDQVENYIDAEVPLLIKYEKENGDIVFRSVSAYEVRPVLDFDRSGDYLVGYDHYREGIRNFRIDRILGICPSAKEFRPEEV